MQKYYNFIVVLRYVQHLWYEAVSTGSPKGPKIGHKRRCYAVGQAA